MNDSAALWIALAKFGQIGGRMISGKIAKALSVFVSVCLLAYPFGVTGQSWRGGAGAYTDKMVITAVHIGVNIQNENPDWRIPTTRCPTRA